MAATSRQGAWATLVGLGSVVGLVLQAILLAHAHRSVGSWLLVSLLAIVVGAFGAKLWYIVVYRGQRYDGWRIQGFIADIALSMVA